MTSTDLQILAPVAPVPAAPPKMIVLDWTDFCNLKCTFCDRDNFERQTGGRGGFTPLAKLRMLEQPLREIQYLMISSGIGEPLLHPEFKEILDWLDEINPSLKLRIVTNGTTLDADRANWLAGRLDWLSVSLNASNARGYLRDMYPHEFAKGIDGTKRWDYLLRRLAEFIQTLPAGDRQKIRIQSVTHCDNVEDVPDFVRLVARIGSSHAVITPILVLEEARLDMSLYWIKDRYNDLFDEASRIGTDLSVRVDGARFYASVKPTLDLDSVCRDPVENAYLAKNNLNAPCCQWVGPPISMDVFADDQAFSRYWNNDTFQRLRAKRDSQSCKVCGLSRVFDEFASHFTSSLKQTLIRAQRLSHIEANSVYPDCDLVRACAKERLDLPSLRHTALKLGVATDRLGAIEREGRAALAAIDRACWDAFLAADVAPATGATPFAGAFLGVGWGSPIYEPQNRVSARWVGAQQWASIFTRLPPGHAAEIRFEIHHAHPESLVDHVALAAGDETIKSWVEIGASRRKTLVGIVPHRVVDAHGGRLWLRVGYFGDADVAPTGHLSLVGMTTREVATARLVLNEFVTFQRSAGASIAHYSERLIGGAWRRYIRGGFRAVGHWSYEKIRWRLWHPFRRRAPGLSDRVLKAARDLHILG